MPQPSRRVSEFQNAEAAIAFVDPQQRDPLQSQIGVNAPRQGVTLHAVVLNAGENPGNDGLGNGGIGRRAVDDRQFGPKRNSQRDMGGVGADRSQHRPNLVLIDHLHDLVAGSAPQRAVVVDLQAEWRPAVASPGVGFIHGHLDAVQHRQTQRLVFIVLNRPQKADRDLRDVRRSERKALGGRAVVFRCLGVPLVIRLGELRKRARSSGEFA